MPSSPATGSRTLAALRLFCLSLIALHLAAPLFEEGHAWGIWPFTALPVAWRWALAAIAALLCLTPIAHHASRLTPHALRLTPYASRLTPYALRLTPYALRLTPYALRLTSRHARFIAIALLAAIPFFLFPIVHTRWGDAHILVYGIAYPDPALRITATWQAPLDVWLHARLWLLGHRLWGWEDAWPVYRIVSPLAGAVYVYLLLRLADSVGRNRTEKGLIVGLLGTLGTMQLFFGYAENYVLAAAGILIFVWLSLETLAGRRALWQPALALALTNGLHPSTVVMSPTLLYMAWIRSMRCEASSAKPQAPSLMPRGHAFFQIAAPTLLVAGGVILLMTLSGHGLEKLVTTDRPGGGDARWFVPLTEATTRWEHYTMFSWAHLRDWLNMQLLTAPVTLGGLMIVGASLTLRRQAGPAKPAHVDWQGRSAEIPFLLLATALYWLFTWVWNPDYGGQRDWDLFSLAAIPSTLLLARLLPLALRRRNQLAQAGLMLTAVSAMHTAAWIYQNTLPWEWP